MGASHVLLIFMRIAMAFQIIVGIGFWTGHWFGLVPLHMATGILFVLAFWAIAIIALVQRRATGLAVFSLLLGLVVVALGMTQQSILIGDLHWIVRVNHLVVGVASMPFAERLVGVPRPSGSPQPA